MLALSLLTSAGYAGEVQTIQACYATAEGANTGLSVTVKTGSTTRLTSGDLDAVFDTIAQYHASSNLNLTYNAAGEAALEQALDCIFDAHVGSLSSVVANERFAAIRQRDHTGTFTLDGEFDGNFRFDYYESSTCTGAPGLMMKEVSGNRTATFVGTALGSHDMATGFTAPLECVPAGNCTGGCMGVCGPGGPQDISCACITGDCESQQDLNSHFDSYNVIILAK